MKKENKRFALQYYVTLVLFLVLPFATLIAQSEVKIDGRDVGSWFERNWMWVAGGALILLILALSGRGGSKRKSTTIVKDDLGNVRSVSTTEVKE